MRTVFGSLVAILATVAAALACFVVLLLSPRGKLGPLVTRWWGRAVLWGGGIRIRRRVEAPLPKGGCVFVANHSSMLDICTAAAAIPKRFHFVSRPFFFKIPFLGWGMLAARHIPLDPKKPRAAAEALETVRARIGRGMSVLMFAEGTRSPDGIMRRYKRGPFVTAIAAGAPVVPVRLVGVHERMLKGSMRMIPGEVGVIVGTPVETRGMVEEDAKALARRMEDWTRNAAAPA